MLDRLKADSPSSLFVDPAALGSMEIPDPVRRYFDRVFQPQQPLVRTARLVHQGTFFVNGKWLPFRSEQFFAADPLGFVWDARIQMAPFIEVWVRDSYINQHGSMLGLLLGLFPLVDQHDRPELDSGALHRYLAEAMWFPTSLLPRDGLAWTSVDDSHAIATLTDGPNSVALQFEFTPTGEIAGVFTTERYKEVSGNYVKASWGATCRRYERFEGMLIPVECEVYWKDADRILPYWRGTIVQASYEFNEAKP